MDTRLPKTYKSYKEFININVLGEEEGKAGDTDGKEPTEFAKMFYADMDKAIAERKKSSRERRKRQATKRVRTRNKIDIFAITICDGAVNTCHRRKDLEQLNIGCEGLVGGYVQFERCCRRSKGQMTPPLDQ